MLVLARRSNERCGVNVGGLTDGRGRSAAVAALGWVCASASQALAWRWAAGDSIADRPASTSEAIGKRLGVDASRVGDFNCVVAGRKSGQVVTMRIVDKGRF